MALYDLVEESIKNGRPEHYSQMLGKAREYAASGKADECLQTLNMLIDKYPLFYEAFIMLSNILLSTDRDELAMDVCGKYLKNDPDQVNLLNNMAISLAKTNREKGAIYYFCRICILDLEYAKTKSWYKEIVKDLDWNKIISQGNEEVDKSLRRKENIVYISTGKWGPCITYKYIDPQWVFLRHCKKCNREIFVDDKVILDGNDFCLDCGEKLELGMLNQQQSVENIARIKCPKCKIALDSDSIYCDQCGYKVTEVMSTLSQQQPVENTSRKYCPKCGEKNNDINSFCTKCKTILIDEAKLKEARGMYGHISTRSSNSEWGLGGTSAPFTIGFLIIAGIASFGTIWIILAVGWVIGVIIQAISKASKQ